MTKNNDDKCIIPYDVTTVGSS